MILKYILKFEKLHINPYKVFFKYETDISYHLLTKHIHPCTVGHQKIGNRIVQKWRHHGGPISSKYEKVIMTFLDNRKADLFKSYLYCKLVKVRTLCILCNNWCLFRLWSLTLGWFCVALYTAWVKFPRPNKIDRTEFSYWVYHLRYLKEIQFKWSWSQ